MAAVNIVMPVDSVWAQNSAGDTRTANRSSDLPPVSVETGPGKRGSGRTGRGGGLHSIVALVNDEPITGYEIEQRASMLVGSDVQKDARSYFQSAIKSERTTARLKAILGKVIKANQGKSKDEIIAIFERRKKAFAMGIQKTAVQRAKAKAMPKVRKQATDELIDEKLKLQEAKRLNVSVDDKKVDEVIKNIAKRNKMTKEQLAKQLGGSLSPLKNRIKSSLSWNEVVRQKYGARISISSSDVDRFVESDGAKAADASNAVELDIKRVRFIIPASLSESAVAKRVLDADRVRAKFTGCASIREIVKGEAGVKLDDLGRTPAGKVPEPTRTFLLNARDGEILPPTVGKGGVELWIRCGQTNVGADYTRRKVAENQLKKKEFEMFGRRHLKDLRQDALIEYR